MLVLYFMVKGLRGVTILVLYRGSLLLHKKILTKSFKMYDNLENEVSPGGHYIWEI